jgi:hypothetical protein
MHHHRPYHQQPIHRELPLLPAAFSRPIEALWLARVIVGRLQDSLVNQSKDANVTEFSLTGLKNQSFGTKIFYCGGCGNFQRLRLKRLPSASFPPIACSTTRRAFWAKSSGSFRLGCFTFFFGFFFIPPLSRHIPAKSSGRKFKVTHYRRNCRGRTGYADERGNHAGNHTDSFR